MNSIKDADGPLSRPKEQNGSLLRSELKDLTIAILAKMVPGLRPPLLASIITFPARGSKGPRWRREPALTSSHRQGKGVRSWEQGEI